jgi:hypothetical protein
MNDTDDLITRLTMTNVDRLVLVITLVLIFLAAARTPIDSDMWWHLRAGSETWIDGQPLLHDTASFTRLNSPWINHSWLSQVFMYLAFQLGGYLALGATVALLAAGMMALVFLQQDGPGLLRSFLLILSTTVASVVWTPRPQTVSLFLFAFTGYILFLYKWRQRDYAWVLVPLFILWSNLHGGYPLGLLAIGSMIAGETINHLLKVRGPQVLEWKKVRKLILIGVVCYLVVAVNPNGVGAWLIPFQTVGVRVLQNFIQEWASPDFHNLIQQTLLWLVFTLIAAVGLSGRRIDGSDLVTVIVFGLMAFIARRNYGPLALVAAPVISRHLWIFLRDMRRSKDFKDRNETETAKPIPNWQRGLNLLIVAVLGFAALGKLYVVTHPAFINTYLQTTYPLGAVTWIREWDQGGNVFNEYGWGGYISWTVQETAIFVDGRTDLFGDEIIGEWMTVVHAQSGWQDILEKRRVDLVLLEVQRPVVAALEEAGWKELFRDGHSVLFGR